MLYLMLFVIILLLLGKENCKALAYTLGVLFLLGWLISLF